MPPMNFVHQSRSCRVMLPSLGVNGISESIKSVKSVAYCSIGLICLLMRIIMSVGYKPYVKSGFRMYEEGTHVQYSLR